MKSKAATAARVILGGVFFGFGLNGLLHFIPLPQGEGKAAEFIGGLAASGYFFPLLFVTYLFAGAALLIDRFVPLALTVLAPVIVNITIMHLFLPSSGAEMCLAMLVTMLEIFLAWCYRSAFRQLLQARYALNWSGQDSSGIGERHGRE
jgi:hypothetical protein